MKVGFYEAEVTPPLGTGIPGYFFQRNAVAVKQRLYVKAMVVESGGAYAAVLGVDALALPFNFPERVRENVAKRIPIDPYSIAMGATHAHTSMPVRPDQYADDNVEEVAALMKIIVRRAADAIVLAYQRLQEADAFYATTNVDGIACVRNCVLKDGQIRTNPSDFLDQVVRTAAEPDPTLPLLLFKDKQGNPIGTLVSFACHHDTVCTSEYSSDYSGVLARLLKEQYGPDFVSVFVSGFSGDINHANFLLKKPVTLTTEQIGERLFRGYLEAANTAEKLTDDTVSCKWDTLRATKRDPGKEFLDSVKVVMAGPEPEVTYDEDGNRVDKVSEPYSDNQKYAAGRTLLEWYDNDEREKDIPLLTIRIGDFVLYSTPGEPFCDYAKQLRQLAPTDKTLMMQLSHIGYPVSYIPTPERFLPYVYESAYYSAGFEPETGDNMVAKLTEMAKSLF